MDIDEHCEFLRYVTASGKKMIGESEDNPSNK